LLFMSLTRSVINHPIVPILLGAVVALDGTGNIIARGAALLACGLWFSFDIGRKIFEKSSAGYWRSIICGSVSGVTFISIGYIMQWLLLAKLDEQRTDVYQHLTGNHYLLSNAYDDPMFTMFSVTNGGKVDISKNHQMTCYTRSAVGNDDTSHFANFTSGYFNHKMAYYPGFNSVRLPPSDSLVRSSGDSEATPCLSYYHFAHGARCVDMTLIFSYSLETQPDFTQQKLFRYVAIKGGHGEFAWSGEPVDDQRNFCAVFRSHLMPQ
jgi:hypothetical protein